MKIAKVTPWIITAPSGPLGAQRQPGRQYVFVQVDTDAGITGWGEITGTGALPNRAVAAVVREVGPFLEGEDASGIEAIM